MLTRVLRYAIMVIELRATAGMDKHVKTLQGICEDWLTLVKHTQTHKHLLLLEIKGSWRYSRVQKSIRSMFQTESF